MNLNKILNENISICLSSLTKNEVSHSHNLLETKIKLIPTFTNSHLFLMQFFEKYFSFIPPIVYFNDQYVFYFLPTKRNRMINAKYTSKKTAFHRKFTKNLYFVNYDGPVQIDVLIKNLFQHVPFHFLEYNIERLEVPIISVYIYLKENHLKFALGRKGAYIKSINEIIHSYVDRRITFFLRSLGV